jgi:parallel beta-helix repeat protein
MKINHSWLPKFILGFCLYTVATGTSFAQTVNCGMGESIQAALDAEGIDDIIVEGTCLENIVINGDISELLQIVAGSPGSGVQGVTPGVPSITIRGASGVIINGLTVSGNNGDGIALSQNASAMIQNTTIENNAGHGINVEQGAFANLIGNSISSNGKCGVRVSDSASARLQGNGITSDQADVNVCAAVGVYRDAFVHMFGANSVTNTTGTGLAVQVDHNSTLQQNAGHTTVSGNVEDLNGSSVDFRDVAIMGNVSASANSQLRLRDQGTVPSNVTVTGDIFINETDVATFLPVGVGATVNGTIHCNGGTLFGSSNVTATAIDCPAPIHVLRADGTAKIRAEELNAAVAARSMFELVNNGPIGFNMTNTDLTQTWRFAAQTTGFRVSLDGTGGPELEVGNGGTLQVGPGGAANLTLDASGNLTVAGTVNGVSDRNAKTAIVALNGAEVLTKLTALPVSQWAYKKEPAVNHIGPMAQDFYGAFGLGADDKHLAPGDLAGVAVIGVKALHKMIEARDATIAAHEAKIVEQESKIATQAAKLAERATEIAELKQRLVALEGMVSRIVAKQTTRTAQR